MNKERKTGNQKRKFACNRYEDIEKQIGKILDKFGADENIQIVVYWTRRLQKERAKFRKKAVKLEKAINILNRIYGFKLQDKKFSGFYELLIPDMTSDELIKEEYVLLKEVLEDERI